MPDAPVRADVSPPATPSDRAKTLQLDRVALRVGARQILHPLSLDVAPAAITVLLGPKRAGKTALLRLMAGLERPTRGRVLADGRDVTGVPVRERKVAMVYSRFINYPALSVFDNIAAPLKLSGAEGFGATVKALAERLQIGHLLDRFPAQLSGGEQQRVAFARALVKDAPLLLLDEPLVNLDQSHRAALLDDLIRLFTPCEASVVYATTDPKEALLMGGYTAIIDQGRILQHGRTIDVFLRPASIEVALAFSDPPINLAAGVALRSGLQITNGPVIALQAPLATPVPDVTVGMLASDIRVRGRGGDVHFDARVELAEIAGSDTFVHVSSHLGPLVAQVVGVQRFDLGQPLRLHIDPGALFVFGHDRQLLLAPERLQLREQVMRRRSAEPT